MDNRSERDCNYCNIEPGLSIGTYTPNEHMSQVLHDQFLTYDKARANSRVTATMEEMGKLGANGSSHETLKQGGRPNPQFNFIPRASNSNRAPKKQHTTNMHPMRKPEGTQSIYNKIKQEIQDQRQEAIRNLTFRGAGTQRKEYRSALEVREPATLNRNMEGGDPRRTQGVNTVQDMYQDAKIMNHNASMNALITQQRTVRAFPRPGSPTKKSFSSKRPTVRAATRLEEAVLDQMEQFDSYLNQIMDNKHTNRNNSLNKEIQYQTQDNTAKKPPQFTTSRERGSLGRGGGSALHTRRLQGILQPQNTMASGNAGRRSQERPRYTPNQSPPRTNQVSSLVTQRNMVIENQEDLIFPADDPMHPANRLVSLQYQILKAPPGKEDSAPKFQVDIISRDHPELGGLAPTTYYLEDVKEQQVILILSRDSFQFNFEDVKEIRLKFNDENGFFKARRDMPLAEAISRLPPKKNVIQVLIFVYPEMNEPSTSQLSKEIEVLRRQMGGVTPHRNKRDLERLEERMKREMISKEEHLAAFEKLRSDFASKLAADNAALETRLRKEAISIIKEETEARIKAEGQLEKMSERVEEIEEAIESMVSTNNTLQGQVEELQNELQRVKKEFRTQSLYTTKSQAITNSQIISTNSLGNIPKAFWEQTVESPVEAFGNPQALMMRKSQSHMGEDLESKKLQQHKNQNSLKDQITAAAMKIIQKNQQDQPVPCQIRHQSSISVDHPDLVFFYSEPLVDTVFDEKLQKQKFVSTGSQTLSTEVEFKRLMEILKSTSKDFKICKEAINFESLKEMIAKKPKIIHISCHGDFCDEKKEFYLQFEGIGNGVADKFYQSRLQDLLGEETDHGIKLAFVSACHSEEIGNVLHQCKIPIVIAVNSDSQIADDICLIFSRHFYMQLLQGVTVQKAFQEAQRTCRASPVSCESCCCAHSHADSCKWYKFAQKEGFEKAHELHSGTCGCNLPLNRHKTSCPRYQSFMTFIREYKDPEEEAKKAKAASANIWALPDDFDEDFLVSYDNQEEDNVICCCKKDIPHDESIKFILKADEKNLNQVLFNNRPRGKLKEIEQKGVSNHVSSVYEVSLLIGKNLEIQKCVERLTSDDSQKLIIIQGETGTGKQIVAKQAIHYCVERNYFRDGAYEIDAGQRKSCQGLVSQIFQDMRMSIAHVEDFIDLVKFNHIVMLIYQANDVMAHDSQSFQNFIMQLLDRTHHLKIILTVTSENQFQIPSRRFPVITMQPLNRYYAAKILKSYDQNDELLSQDEVELQKHEIFAQNLTNQQIQDIYLLLKSNQTLDDVAKLFKAQKERQQLMEASSKELQETNFNIQVILYQHMEERYPNEVNLLHLLSQAPSGLTLDDIKENVSQKPYTFGNWEDYLCSMMSDFDTAQKRCLPCEGISDGGNSVNLSEESEEREKAHGFKVIFKKQYDDINQSVYFLKRDVRQFINGHVLEKNRYFQFFQFVRYFSKLGRLYLRNFKLLRKKDFDINILSAEIDSGLWDTPKYSVLAHISNDNDFENLDVDNVETRIAINEGNFAEAFNHDLVVELFKSRIKTFPQIIQFLDELYITFVSLLLTSGKSKEALDFLEMALRICRTLDLRQTQAKLILIYVSIEIKNKRLFNIKKQLGDAHDLFAQTLSLLGKAETWYLETVWHMLEFSITNLKRVPTQTRGISNSLSQKLSLSHEGSANYLQNLETLKSVSSDAKKMTIGVLSENHEHEMMEAFDHMLKPLNKDQKDKLRKLEHSLEDALKIFEDTSEELGIARCILLRAQFLFNNFWKTDQQKHRFEDMPDDLDYSSEVFERHLYLSHQSQCLIYLALLQQDNKDYQQARMSIQMAITKAKEIQNYELLKKATEILSDVQLDIQINSNNLVIFMTASPLIDNSDIEPQELSTDYLVNPQFEKFQSSLCLRSLGKQVNVMFENLTIASLSKLRDYGCRVLVINSKYSDKNSNLCIEGEDGLLQRLTPEQLFSQLKPKEGQINIDAVFLNIEQSEQLARVFTRLSVPHVFSFKVIVDQIAGRQLLRSALLSRPYLEAMVQRHFTTEMISNLFRQRSFFKSYSSTTKALSKVYPDYDFSKLVWTQLNNENSGDKLFDDNSLDERKILNDGAMEDQSTTLGPCNLEMKSGPIIGRKKELYQILQKVRDPEVKIISIRGQLGIGKTRLVKELTMYSAQHKIITDGVYYMDFKSVSTSKDIDQAFNDAGIQNLLKQDEEIENRKSDTFKKQESGSERSFGVNRELKKKDSTTSSEKHILLIYDNVDKLAENATVFVWHVTLILKKKVDIIFTHKKKIRTISSMSNLFQMVLEPLTTGQSIELLKFYSLRPLALEEFKPHKIGGKYEKEPTFGKQKTEKSDSSDPRTCALIDRKLQESKLLQQCNGNPQFLIVLALVLRVKKFNQIEIRQSQLTTFKTGITNNSNTSSNQSQVKTIKQELHGIRERESVYRKLKDRITSTFKQIANLGTAEPVNPGIRRATMRQTIKKRKEIRKQSVNHRRQSGSIKIPKNSGITTKQVFQSPEFRRFQTSFKISEKSENSSKKSKRSKSDIADREIDHLISNDNSKHTSPKGSLDPPPRHIGSSFRNIKVQQDTSSIESEALSSDLGLQKEEEPQERLMAPKDPYKDMSSKIVVTPLKPKNKLANLVSTFEPSPECNLAPPSLHKLDKNPSNIAVANLDARSVGEKLDNASIQISSRSRGFNESDKSQPLKDSSDEGTGVLKQVGSDAASFKKAKSRRSNPFEGKMNRSFCDEVGENSNMTEINPFSMARRQTAVPQNTMQHRSPGPMFDNFAQAPRYDSSQNFGQYAQSFRRQSMRMLMKSRFHARMNRDQDEISLVNSLDDSLMNMQKIKSDKKFEELSAVKVQGVFQINEDQKLELDLWKNIRFTYIDQLLNLEAEILGSDFVEGLIKDFTGFSELKEKVIAHYKEITSNVSKIFLKQTPGQSRFTVLDFFGGEIYSNQDESGDDPMRRVSFEDFYQPTRGLSMNSIQPYLYEQNFSLNHKELLSHYKNVEQELHIKPKEPLKIVISIPFTETEFTMKDDLESSQIFSAMEQQSMIGANNFGSIIEQHEDEESLKLKKSQSSDNESFKQESFKQMQPEEPLLMKRKSNFIVHQETIQECAAEDEENLSMSNSNRINRPHHLDLDKHLLSDISASKRSQNYSKSSFADQNVQSQANSSIVTVNPVRSQINFLGPPINIQGDQGDDDNDSDGESEFQRLPPDEDDFLRQSLQFEKVKSQRQTTNIPRHEKVETESSEELIRKETEQSHDQVSNQSNTSGRNLFERNMMVFHGQRRLNSQNVTKRGHKRE